MILIAMGLHFIFQECIYFSYQELNTISLSIWRKPICSFALYSKSYIFFRKWQKKHINYNSKKKLVSIFPFKHILGFQHKMAAKDNKIYQMPSPYINEFYNTFKNILRVHQKVAANAHTIHQLQKGHKYGLSDHSQKHSTSSSQGGSKDTWNSAVTKRGHKCDLLVHIQKYSSSFLQYNGAKSVRVLAVKFNPGINALVEL